MRSSSSDPLVSRSTTSLLAHLSHTVFMTNVAKAAGFTRTAPPTAKNAQLNLIRVIFDRAAWAGLCGRADSSTLLLLSITVR